MNLEHKIESILLFKNEPVAVSELSKSLSVSKEELLSAIKSLQEFYSSRGIVVVFDGEQVSFGTHPKLSPLMEEMQKEEFSRELGRASLETLAIILYKGKVSRREIDYIRGVNSTFSLRSLMMRGLIERVDPSSLPGGERSYSYKPTITLLEHLGVTRVEDLPNFEDFVSKINKFVESTDKEDQDAN